MPRERAKLSEKQERVLVQAQLMGLTARDMQQIGNRLIALQREREEITNINSVTENYSWEEPKSIEQLSIKTPDGYTLEAKRGKKGQSRWGQYSWNYDITVTKSGTRFKPRLYKNVSLNCSYDWKKKLMPGKSKELYALIRWHQHSMNYETYENTTS